MAYDPFSAKPSDRVDDPAKLDYDSAEANHEISQLRAALAGIASGIIKIPEGFVSLGAEIMDATGMTANAAAKVEQVFDTINPFEEVRKINLK